MKKRCVVMVRRSALDGIRVHPRLADRQPAVGGVADADEAEPPGFLQRGQPGRPQFARRERRRMVRTVERQRLAHFRGAGDHGPARMKPRAPGLRQFAGEFGARAIGRGAVRIHRHLTCGDVGRRGQHRERDREPDRGQMKQRDASNAQRRNRHQRQRRQEEQRDSPIGLHIDREGQRAEHRADRDHGLDDPDIERLRPVHARIGAARPCAREQRRRLPASGSAMPAQPTPARSAAPAAPALWPM